MGNRLQNYALQFVLSKYSSNITNLDNGYSEFDSRNYKHQVKELIKNILSFLGLKKYKDWSIYNKNRRARYLINKEFTDKYIHNITKVTYDNVYQKNWNNYDLAIVGSDQVWHKWRDNDKELPYYYLEFLPESKRASYAASFGFDEFPKEDREQHVEGLRGMKYISCRETSGCNLVKKVTGQRVPHVLDPTLLLNAQDWRKLSSDSNHYSKSQKKYAFIYFLGELTPEYESEIKRILNTKGLEAINFLDFMNSEISNCGPKEFISLIDNSDIVLTDSFHATVFSILFDKPFEVFRRKGKGMEKMFSRIEELLVNTGNQDKSFDSVTSNLKTENLNSLRQTSINYIEKVLNDEVQ